MGKLEAKRIELAKRILETTDKKSLDRVAAILDDPAAFTIPEQDVKAFEEYLERYERGEEKPKEWSVVKKRLARTGRR